MELFGRQAIVTVGTTQIAATTTQRRENKQALRIAFRVERTLAKEPNTAELTIYNLSKATRAIIGGGTSKIPVVIEAGYEGNVSQIFSGDLGPVAIQLDGTNVVTSLQSKDAGRNYRNARVNVSFKGGLKPDVLAKAISSAFGVSPGNLFQKLTSVPPRTDLQVFAKGVVVSGKAEFEMDKLMKSLGFEWSIQDGAIQVLEPTATVGTRISVLSSGTGLVGSPEPGEKGIVTARTLLQPDLVPGQRVQFVTANINGFYRIQKSTFTGDTWQSDWYTELECKPL